MMPNSGHIMTLANSIIGVGILAMPFCFQKCGVILSILLLIVNNLITRISCHYLIKSSVITRRRSFEFLAFHAFGFSGKLMVELCVIGYLLGTCIAYFVVVGDLGPQIVAKILNLTETTRLRSWVMVLVTFLCIIPLGLLKNVDSLSTVCTASIGFYFCLIFKVISESSTYFIDNHWMKNIEYWKPSGILQCLPIFSMALACQIQLFEVLETLPNPSVEKMNYVVNVSTMLCTYVYILVGFFGYVAFCSQPFSGNILVQLSPSLASDAIKMGFVLSVAFSFPLVIFPCRASIYSLLYRKGHTDTTGYIPEFRFKIITISIILFSLCVGLLIPSIELVIGLVGSTIGIAICVIFPALCFMKVSKKETSERSLAQFILVGGFCLMILGTYANLSAIDEKKFEPSTSENFDVNQNFKYKNISDNSKLKEKGKLLTNSENMNVQQNKDGQLNNAGQQKNTKVSVEEKHPLVVEDKKIQKTVVADKPKTIIVDRYPKDIDAVSVKSNNLIEIDKDAIKKEEEITAEEEDKKVKHMNKAANELEKTKELLERKVDELKAQLAQQNAETQNLVVEKLGDIVQKVKQIEKEVYKDTPNQSKAQNDAGSPALIVENNSIEKNHDSENNSKATATATIKPKVYSSKESVKETEHENIEDHGKPIQKLNEEIFGISKPEIEVPKEIKTNNSQRTNTSVISHSLETVLNESKAFSPLPLPLLINASSVKYVNKSENLINVDESKKIFEENKLEIKENDNPKQEHKVEIENNIESIRRDILEVVTDDEKVPSVSNNLREKREVSELNCLHWNVMQNNCLDDSLISNLNTINSNDKIQSIGRDLKFVR